MVVKPDLRRRTWAVVFVATLAVGACGDDKVNDNQTRASDPPSVAPSSAPASSAPVTPEALAIAAYQRSWEVEFAALNPPNPQDPRLGEVFTGKALQSITDIIVRFKQDGRYAVGYMETHPRIVSVTPDKVVLSDCTVEHSTEYDQVTGAIRDQGPYPPRSREIEVVNQSGTWRVSVIRTPPQPCTPR
jgi:hypothetical protein